MVLMFSIVLSRTYKTVSLCLCQLCIVTFLLCVKWNKNSSKTDKDPLISFPSKNLQRWLEQPMPVFIHCSYFFSYYLYVNVDRAQEISCILLWHLHLLVQLQDSQMSMEEHCLIWRFMWSFLCSFLCSVVNA